MDIEKLIETLRQHGVSCVRAHGRYCSICDEAATALSTLQAENKRLNKIVCSIPTTPDSGRTVSQYDKEMSMCAYLDDLEAENEKLRNEVERQRRSADDRKHLYENAERAYMKVVAELERVTAERDAVIKELNGVSSLVDDLAEFVDREIHPVVDYNLYLDLRENVDAVAMFQHEDEWRGLHKEE